MMTTERYCTTLEALDRAEAIRAIHAALAQLRFVDKEGESSADNADAIASLESCLKAAGHVGFTA